ncbi:cyclic nucleotide-binding domain-containing protein, partial [Corallococcus sp. 4LFB]|uniref:cyclic nucleotide-binding domain-containing protein n=1 Tax=Corallococcus sp. 4LFB TaxID=3383249 RepID=UPI0039765D3F
REAFVALVDALEVRAFWPGQRVVEEGQPGDSMFALVEGRAEVARRVEGNARQVVATLGPGDFFGEVALVSEGPGWPAWRCPSAPCCWSSSAPRSPA